MDRLLLYSDSESEDDIHLPQKSELNITINTVDRSLSCTQPLESRLDQDRDETGAKDIGGPPQVTSSEAKKVTLAPIPSDSLSDFFGLDKSGSESEDGYTKVIKTFTQTTSTAVSPTPGSEKGDPGPTSGNDYQRTSGLLPGDCATQNNSECLQIPDSDFWQSNHKSCDWANPHKIWHVQNETSTSQKDASNPHKRARDVIPQLGIKQYRPKRNKVDETQTSMPSVKLFQPLVKTCYSVHHKIAPFIHASSKQNNSIPKKKLAELSGHPSLVNQLEWCVPQYSHLLLSASMDFTVKIWNVFSSVSHCVQTFDYHTKAVTQATWSSSGRQILTGSYDKTSRIFDVEKGTLLMQYNHDSVVSCVKYHPVDFNLFITGSLNLLQCWDTRSKPKPIRKYHYKDAFGQVQDICFLPNGQEFFTCNDQVSRDSADRNIMAWDFHKGVVLSNQIYQERYTCTRLKVHPSEAQLCAQTQGNYIALFSTIKPYKMNKHKRYEGHKVLGYNIGFDISPNGGLVASGSCDGCVHFYNAHQGRNVHKLSLGGPRDTVCMDVAWHPLLPSVLATSTWDGTLAVWQ